MRLFNTREIWHCSKETQWIKTRIASLYLIKAHLIIDEQLHGAVSPLYQHNLIGLTRDAVRERGSDSRTGTGLEPHTHSEGVHLWQALLDAAIQVVGAQRQRHLKVLWRFECTVTCKENQGRGLHWRTGRCKLLTWDRVNLILENWIWVRPSGSINEMSDPCKLM